MPDRSAALSNPSAKAVDGGADLGRQWLDAVEAGDLLRAARVSDRVLAARDPATRDDPRLPYHLRWVWDGRPLKGRDVLVRCYHGLGDTLQFCRYLPLLAAEARSVAVEAQPELLPVLRGLHGGARWIPFDTAHPAPPAEADIEIMELMHAFPVPPPGAPYLRPPGRDAYQEELGGGVLVGLCWEAGGWDPARSVPLAALWDALAAALPDGAGPVLLQRGPAAEKASPPGVPRFRNPGDRSLDLLRTAGLLAACDVVVTVDTMVAHLAGALGLPAAVLLRAGHDWRWRTGIVRDAGPEPRRSAWYPSLRLFPQVAEGDWSAPLLALRAWMASGAARPASLPAAPGVAARAGGL